ncbi:MULTISPECIES: maleylpyruvate isomerase family mycothiol-dependent enzyme [unclassified Dietzia]|uniref:maleylpyruvate isomerase family mycothiol-dependent enzyme n=1 Tax=unclassified Dietzia TaxID=2617939 RepID=UPI0015F9DFF0|nr:MULTISPECIES: maleylpyruvate isomerase family mycothiol-dependent enzyme [unclassified Dietzia]MBB1025612.1 maleylpyruvate isomerase family mycothiol-dependent enzyme [Dietzia sp. DQ12-76]MBB1028197.1 maleylpyruvate isomerase family mycothiol-dependent enzyme [Dietzia sp. DQ11-38-2]
MDATDSDAASATSASGADTGAPDEAPTEIRHLIQQWNHLDELLAGLKRDDWATPTALPGWTVRDVVAHIAGTEHLLAGEPIPDVDLPASSRDYVRNPIGELNERFVQEARSLAVEDAFADFREVVAERTVQLSEMTAEDLEAETDSPVGRVPFRRFMGVRVFDCWVHEDDIRHALGMTHHLDSGVGRFALGEIARALPRIVGKNAGAPDGSRVRFRVKGDSDADPSLATDVLVAGRAGLVDVDDSARVSVELVFDTPTFVRSATGRISAEPGNGVEISGDEELGRRILESMAFTI